MTGQSLNSENAKELGINKTEGFYVNETDPEMGAHIAGMRSSEWSENPILILNFFLNSSITFNPIYLSGHG